MKSERRRTLDGWSVRPVFDGAAVTSVRRSHAAVTAAGERDDALEGLVHYCAAEATLAAAGLIGPAQIEWLDRVRESLDNYRRALAWLIEHGRPGADSDIVWGLMFFWLIRGPLAFYNKQREQRRMSDTACTVC